MHCLVLESHLTPGALSRLVSGQVELITSCDSDSHLEKLYDNTRSGWMQSVQNFLIFFPNDISIVIEKSQVKISVLLTSNFQLSQRCLAPLRDHCLI